MDYTKKLLYQSNYWYNDGLKKAKIRDMSSAIASLRRSLQYNKENIAARNLLGLVYYGRGEVVEALVEWIISKNLKSHENIATYYIKKVQDTPNELDVINQAIKKYNQCLVYCSQDGEDLAVIQLKKVVAAHPTFLKAYQLLALLYLHTEQYGKAKQVLRRAHKLDTTSDITLRYMHELTQMHTKKPEKVKKEKESKETAVTYQLGNETIIQPVISGIRDNAGILTILNIILGIVVGAAVVWFLIVPSMDQSRATKTNKEVLAYTDQLSAKEAEISALKKELENYRATSDQTEATMATAASTKTSYESLMTVSEQFSSYQYSDETMAESLKQIERESLGDSGKARYDTIADEVYGRLCNTLYSNAQASYKVANYESSITALESVIEMQTNYESGQALLLLADAYKMSGNEEKATETYNRIRELLPNMQIAATAEKRLSGVKPEHAQDDSDTE